MTLSPDSMSVTMLCLLKNSEAGGVREDRWLPGEGCGRRNEMHKKTQTMKY